LQTVLVSLKVASVVALLIVHVKRVLFEGTLYNTLVLGGLAALLEKDPPILF
jgi:hypothetical protein